ncbi:MAG: hypothetical protein ABI467_31150 [Kofleriaceae bacterium]
MTDRELDELRLLGEELRVVFAAERTAISTLDHAALTTLAETKSRIAARLAELAPLATNHPEVRALFEAVRLEAQATALLAATASNLVNTMLGRETHGYDRRARGTTSCGPAFKNLRAY